MFSSRPTFSTFIWWDMSECVWFLTSFIHTLPSLLISLQKDQGNGSEVDGMWTITTHSWLTGDVGNTSIMAGMSISSNTQNNTHLNAMTITSPLSLSHCSCQSPIQNHTLSSITQNQNHNNELMFQHNQIHPKSHILTNTTHQNHSIHHHYNSNIFKSSLNSLSHNIHSQYK